MSAIHTIIYAVKNDEFFATGQNPSPSPSPGNVMIAGSFNNWEMVPMEKWDDYTYTYAIYGDNDVMYKFIVNGKWIHDPGQPTIKDENNNINNLVMRNAFHTQRVIEMPQFSSSPLSKRSGGFSPLSSSPTGFIFKPSSVRTNSSLTFLGTGTSCGVPNIGCYCQTCMSKDSKDKRLRTSVLLTLKKPSQEKSTNILIDIGPDFRLQALRKGIKQISAVLMTHDHWDHIGGMIELKHYSKVNKSPLPIYGLQETTKTIAERFGPAMSEMGVRFINFEYLSPFFINDEVIIPIEVFHGFLKIAGFCIRDVVYITDVSHLPDNTLEFIKNRRPRILVISAPDLLTFPTHFSVNQAIEISEFVKPERTYLIHFSHFIMHNTVQATLPPNVFLAHDMLEIEIE
eukprot:TRINITY_DN6404_c0_g1_i1.p1 TRINITY_DN6404_c0_g1~~TRINITY_DN6404_c0_g1_i1.p1  ORF type:complete len:399 (+),score=99.59 TRINITY_DN6404_c0_g1_i1:13-1209(+)